ncbi:lytic transglycosylase domain-containing protein [Pelagovum pacificum]|uniref:lytic transglycosylase domain-containing protein n=1 Tax=Pelagovum pacificum TaxID=2588711 RepID=UPI001E4A6333|nr:lytic transglycosylase domain-containing protein [Pelagovum pacificum]
MPNHLTPTMRRLALVSLLFLPVGADAQDGVADLNAAFAAADREDWMTAEELATPGGETGADLVEWMRLRDGDGTWTEYLAFLDRREHWPGTDAIQANAERILPADLAPDDVLAFFEGREVQTGDGVVAKAHALAEAGRQDEADALVVESWETMVFDDAGMLAMRGSFGDLIAGHHAERVDMLLWRWRISDAQEVIPLLDDDQKALAEARIALIRNTSNATELFEAVPASLADSPGLAYDRYNWLADRGRRTDASELLAARSTSAESLGEPFRWSGWRRVLARWEMRDGNPERAYDLAANHFLEEGTEFSDLEWLAGFIALRLLDQPEVALRHFERLEEGVYTPISQGRAWYWIGRAQEALGDEAAAQAAYSEGGKHQTSFYGLLAAEKAGMSLDPELAGTEEFADWRELGLDDNDLVMAGLTLLKGGERGLAVLFFAEMGRTLEREELGALGVLLDQEDEDYFEVLLGKSAAERQIVIPSIYFPVHDMADLDLPVSAALAHSIARTESEFRIDAGSSVGALGLMQLMPTTAQQVSGWIDEPYERARLTRDWAYNARLGSAYLAYLTEEFGNSPVMIAAGYNAGPGRPFNWMSERGDPRLGEVDVIDWIEMIPFRETRNYVMRVTESMPVYRARISGEVGELDFLSLLQGGKPVIRPVARPDGSLENEVSVSTAAIGSSEVALSGVSEFAPEASIRPEERPEREVRVMRGGVSGPSEPEGPRTVSPVSRPSTAGSQ